MDYTHLGRSGLSVSRLCLGTMNFGPETSEDDSHAIMDRALDARHQLLRHRERLRLEEGRGRHRADHRPVVRPGRRAAREDRDRHQALRLDERLAQRHLPVRAQHPARVRRVAAAAADRLHRPLPDAPRRPVDAVGRDLGGVRGPAPAGQGALRRLVQLRRLAHRARRRRRRGAATSLGLVSEQSIYNLLHADGRARGAAGLPGLRPRRHPVVAAARRAARRRPPQDRARASAASTGRAKDGARRRTARRSRRTRTSATSSARTRPTSASPGCCTSRRSPRRSSGRARWSSSTASLRALEITLDEEVLARLDEIFPGPGGPAPRGLRLVAARQTTEPTTTTRTSSASTPSTTRRLVLGSMPPTLWRGRERPGRDVVVRRCRAEPRAHQVHGPGRPDRAGVRRQRGHRVRRVRVAAQPGDGQVRAVGTAALPGHRPGQRTAAAPRSPVTPSHTARRLNAPAPARASDRSAAPRSRRSSRSTTSPTSASGTSP